MFLWGWGMRGSQEEQSRILACLKNQGRSWGISRGVRIHLPGKKRLPQGGAREEKALLIKRQFGSL